MFVLDAAGLMVEGICRGLSIRGGRSQHLCRTGRWARSSCSRCSNSPPIVRTGSDGCGQPVQSRWCSGWPPIPHADHFPLSDFPANEAMHGPHRLEATIEALVRPSGPVPADVGILSRRLVERGQQCVCVSGIGLYNCGALSLLSAVVVIESTFALASLRGASLRIAWFDVPTIGLREVSVAVATQVLAVALKTVGGSA